MDARNSKRVKANDPTAIAEVGKRCRDAGDYEEAVKYFTKAAELGDVNAHHELAAFYDTGVIYHRGEGIKKDHKKFMYHLEEACIGGHALARCDLGFVEKLKGNSERSAKHYIIAAKQGDPPALNVVKAYFTSGVVSEEDYESTLREHQAALDAAKSAQREEAYAYFARVVERRAFFNR
jgi:TPR repeat protein